MVTDDPNDKDYALALAAIFEDIDKLSPEQIGEEFHKIGINFFPEDTQPKNIMLQDIHRGVIFDELDPYFPNSNQKETLERFKKITNDYLNGNFYSSFFTLSGTYTNDNQGYSFGIKAVDNKFMVDCGDREITQELNRVINSIISSGDNEADLQKLQKELPKQISKVTLTSSEIEEYLV